MQILTLAKALTIVTIFFVVISVFIWTLDDEVPVTRTVLLSEAVSLPPSSTQFGKASLTITQGASLEGDGEHLAAVYAAPRVLVLAPNSEATISAFAIDRLGLPIETFETTFSWSVLNKSAGTLDVEEGSTKARFTSSGESGSYRGAVQVRAELEIDGREEVAVALVDIVIQDTVQERPVGSVEPTGGAGILTFARSQLARLDGTAFDPLGQIIPEARIGWELQDQSIGSIVAPGFISIQGEPGDYPNALLLTASHQGGTVTTVVDVRIVERGEVGADSISVRVLPGSPTILTGSEIQLEGILVDRSGRPVSPVSHSWNLRNPSAGTINQHGTLLAGDTPGDYPGVIEFIAEVEIEGRVKTFFASASIKIRQLTPVVSNTLSSLRTDPKNIVISRGNDLLIRAFGLGDSGGVLPGIKMHFQLFDSSIGLMSTGGRLIATGAPGKYENAILVTATQSIDGIDQVIAASVDLVIAGPIIEIVISPKHPILRTSESVNFRAIALDANGVVIPDVNWSWSLLDPEAGRITPFGLFSAGNKTGEFLDIVRAIPLLPISAAIVGVLQGETANGPPLGQSSAASLSSESIPVSISTTEAAPVQVQTAVPTLTANSVTPPVPGISLGRPIDPVSPPRRADTDQTPTATILPDTFATATKFSEIVETPPRVPAPTATPGITVPPTSLATATAAPSATPTITPTRTPRPQPRPTATTVPPGQTPVSTATASPAPTPTPTELPAPTSTPLPTPTSVPTPTSIPTVTPTPSPTPLVQATGDPRFAVVAHADSEALLAERLNTLAVSWYIDYDPDPSTAPPGSTKVPYIKIRPGQRIPADRMSELAASVPGSVWYLGGEPNINGWSGAFYAAELDYYVPIIKTADPTAKIMSASVLNWDFTCAGCAQPSFQSGHAWMEEFIEAYQNTHSGELPPIDIWAIDTYPLRWNAVPMVDWFIVVQQIKGFRDYLDFELFLFNDPIWITEIGSHWAYDDWDPDPNGGIKVPDYLDPVVNYRWDAITKYVESLIRWLLINGPSLKVEKWFFYKDWIDPATHEGTDVNYSGLYFLDSKEAGAGVTPAGEIYRDYSLGLR